MSNAVIAAALETRLKTLADSLGVLVAWEGREFLKPEGMWFEAFLLPNETMNYELSGTRKTYLGLFQVNCWAPTGRGLGPLRALAQSVIDEFQLVPKTGSVSIEATPTADRPIESDPSGWVAVPVLIKYRYEAY